MSSSGDRRTTRSTFSDVKPPVPVSLDGSKKYLIGYNVASAIAWTLILDRLLINLLSSPHLLTSPSEFFLRAGHAHENLNSLVLIVQSSALLEILHASLGLVRSGILTTAMQVASRLFVVWVILPVFPQTAHSPIYASMVLAWSLSEIIRYATYVSSLLQYPLSPLLWLRYSAFYMLYPLGAGSEWGLILLASWSAKQAAPKALLYLLRFGLIIWPPALMVMMRHMSSQRRKYMRTRDQGLKNSKKQS